MIDLKEQLSEWCLHYIDDESIKCITYEGVFIKSGVLGRTLYYKPNISKIYLSSNLIGDIAKREVLWHEFCHAWQYYELHYGSHDIDWLKRVAKRPIYFVYYIYTGIIYLIGALKNL